MNQNKTIFMRFAKLVLQRNSFPSNLNVLKNPPNLQRHYSIYPPFYLHPVYLRAEQQKLFETGEAEKLAFIPVRPPRRDATASVYHDPLVAKFINFIMRKGKKSLARGIMEKTVETVKRIQLDKYHKTTDPIEQEKIIMNPYTLIHKAVENAKPILETTPIKLGGTRYQVPVPVRESRKLLLAFKWLIAAAEDKPDDMRFYTKLAHEIIDAANEQGKVIKRKQDLHKLCEANRAYAHYRWG